MSRNGRRKPLTRSYYDPTLPDDWPGKNFLGSNYRLVSEVDTELLVPNWIKPEWVEWTTVTLIGRDHWGLMGVRHLLAKIGTVRLRVLREIPCDSELADSDVIIWLRLRHDGLPELSGHVASTRRKHPLIKQLVITDALPQEMQRGSGTLSGVWVANGRDNNAVLNKLLAQVITTPSEPAPLFSNILSPRQGSVLIMRAIGLTTEEIAQRLHFSYKTVSTHEVALRQRLGILNHTEYAWLQRSVRSILVTLPVLARLWGVQSIIKS